MILPPATIGILGGGQLARMIALAGKRMGYRFIVYEPSDECPAESVCDLRFKNGYDNYGALADFASKIDVCTLDFENVPSEAANFIQSCVPLRPSAYMLSICQNRKKEKLFLKEHGFPCAKFELVKSPESLSRAIDIIGTPSVLKTADFGYDGKGQIKIDPNTDPSIAWSSLDAPLAVLEEWVNHQGEYSVIVSRDPEGRKKAFPISENLHVDHILFSSTMPASVSAEEEKEAVEIAYQIADQFQMIGLAAIEFFRSDKGWIVNEIAPRPHNSGHLTFDACKTSQFEQCIRAICGLPLGDTHLLTPGVMVNLLGDHWPNLEPNWNRILENSNLKLHLYGKDIPRKGRKMGHLTLLDDDIQKARQTTHEVMQLLKAS